MDRVYSYLTKATRHVEFGANTINNPWSTILRDEHVYRRHQMSDDFTPAAKVLAKETRDVFERGNYIAIFGWLEFVLKHPRFRQMWLTISKASYVIAARLTG